MRILGNADLQRWMQSWGAEYTGKQKSLWKNSIGFGGDPRGALSPRRCLVSFSELRRADLEDSRMSHAHTSMFFTGMQFRHCKVNKFPPISNVSEG